MPILFFFICCIKTLFIQIICGNLITYIQENLGRFQDLLTVSFYMHGTLRSIQNLCHWRSLFGIPIDLIHNTNQKIKANISKRAKFVLAYVYIYVYQLSSHQAVNAHSHHFNDMFSAKAKTLQNHNFQKPTPLTTRSLYIYIYIYTPLIILYLCLTMVHCGYVKNHHAYSGATGTTSWIPVVPSSWPTWPSWRTISCYETWCGSWNRWGVRLQAVTVGGAQVRNREKLGF